MSASKQTSLLAADDFPILVETRTRLKRQLQRKSVDFTDLAPIIEHDPALCWHLLQTAVKHHPGCEGQISGAAGCLSLVGMQELVHLVKHLPVVEGSTPDSMNEMDDLYRRCLHTAYFAGELAAHWTGIKNNVSASYARWSTMLANSPLWLALKQQQPAANWLHYLSEGEDIQHALISALNVKSHANWRKTLAPLRLPKMAHDVFVESHWPNHHEWSLLRRHDPRDLAKARSLLHHCQQPNMTSLIANAVAWHCHINPEHRHSQRWLHIASHWLGRASWMVRQDIRHIQLKISHVTQDGWATGMNLLLAPTATHQQYPRMNTASETVTDIRSATPTRQTTEDHRVAASTKTAQAAMASAPANVPNVNAQPRSVTSSERQGDERYLRKLLQQLQQAPDSFGDLHFLMRGTLKGITQGIGLPHAVIAVYNKDKTQLKVIYREGVSDQDPIRGLSIDLSSTSLFSKLLERSAGVQLTPDNRTQLLRGLPNSVCQRIPQHTLLMSIDAGAKPIGIILAYGDANQMAIDSMEYTLFKRLCQTTSQSLAVLRDNTRRAANKGA
ncbi:MAG: HDOD domain-containing protein [Bacterioplanes sp.]|nr:HDOD domain-containing protein [Bacterioplanes sp.]